MQTQNPTCLCSQHRKRRARVKENQCQCSSGWMKPPHNFLVWAAKPESSGKQAGFAWGYQAGQHWRQDLITLASQKMCKLSLHFYFTLMPPLFLFPMHLWWLISKGIIAPLPPDIQTKQFQCLSVKNKEGQEVRSALPQIQALFLFTLIQGRAEHAENTQEMSSLFIDFCIKGKTWIFISLSSHWTLQVH